MKNNQATANEHFFIIVFVRIINKIIKIQFTWDMLLNNVVQACPYLRNKSFNPNLEGEVILLHPPVGFPLIT